MHVSGQIVGVDVHDVPVCIKDNDVATQCHPQCFPGLGGMLVCLYDDEDLAGTVVGANEDTVGDNPTGDDVFHVPPKTCIKPSQHQSICGSRSWSS